MPELVLTLSGLESTKLHRVCSYGDAHIRCWCFYVGIASRLWNPVPMFPQSLQPRLRSAAAATRQQPLPRCCIQFQQSITRAALSKARSYTSPPSSNPHTHCPTAARLSSRTCMVTGGTSGIGFAIAERFLQEGAERVILVGRSYDRLANAAKRLGEPDLPGGHRTPEDDQNPAIIEAGKKVSLLVGDVSASGSWTRLLEREMVS